MKNFLQNATLKLYASVLMISILALAPAMTRAEGDTVKRDNCCVTGNTAMIDLTKTVRLALPSREALKRADSEATANLFHSLRENKIRKYSRQFAASDAAIHDSFIKLTTIPVVMSEQADEWMNASFAAQHINMNGSYSSADRDITDIFTAEVIGISMPDLATGADDMINNQFHAENISTPSAESFVKADNEMQRNMQADQAMPVVQNKVK